MPSKWASKARGRPVMRALARRSYCATGARAYERLSCVFLLIKVAPLE